MKCNHRLHKTAQLLWQLLHSSARSAMLWRSFCRLDRGFKFNSIAVQKEITRLGRDRQHEKWTRSVKSMEVHYVVWWWAMMMPWMMERAMAWLRPVKRKVWNGRKSPKLGKNGWRRSDRRTQAPYHAEPIRKRGLLPIKMVASKFTIFMPFLS